ncbi:P1 family peptidase [Nocardia zapadnayensis]|nr:P1 family peptidase [Nocardia zapadnayensis]MCX0276263.1 P1 family peptidase [Nocardia zapadnayensis]
MSSPDLPLGTLRRGRGVLEVTGVALGHTARTGEGRLTGTTVIVPPPGTLAGVDVRGGGPASHETDILSPGTLGYGADAVVLTGGSAFGLVAAHGVQRGLRADGRGFPAPGLPGVTVPIVPAAGIFDLGRGGEPAAPPVEEDGLAAYGDARAEQPHLRGSVGAGVGAWTGRGLLRGGLGQASITTPAGHTVAALVVANPMGGVLDPSGRLHCASVLARYGIGVPQAHGLRARFTEFHGGTGDPGGGDGGGDPGGSTGNGGGENAGARNTTIACIVTDARLDAAQTTRLAQSAHAGLARAIHPSHTLFDGDAVFALATGERALDDPEAAALVELNIAAADVLSAAIVDAVLSAEPDTVPGRVTAAGVPAPPALVEVDPTTAEAWRALP